MLCLTETEFFLCALEKMKHIKKKGRQRVVNPKTLDIRSGQTFSVKGKLVNLVGFVYHVVFAEISYLLSEN